MQTCRNPIMRSYEYSEKYGNSQETPSTGQAAEALAYAYQNRMNLVWDALQELDSHTLEAEILFGKDIRTRAGQLRQQVYRLYVAIQDLIANKASGGTYFKENNTYAKRIRKIVYASWEDEDNEFSKQIGDVITEIEKIVRPHLTLS
jgi:hypothetical protein